MAHSEQPKEHYTDGGITVCTGDDCPVCANHKFHSWLTEVKHVLYRDCGWAKLALASINETAWREMFDDGLSVSEAIHEEASN